MLSKKNLIFEKIIANMILKSSYNLQKLDFKIIKKKKIVIDEGKMMGYVA